MKPNKKLFFAPFVILLIALGVSAQQKLVVKQLAEKKIARLPEGSLYWRIENFATIAEANAAAGPMGLAVESKGKAWLFTLGSSGGSTPGGNKVAEVGPIKRIVARCRRISPRATASRKTTGFAETSTMLASP